MQKGDYKTKHLELPWSYLKVYTEERHCTISFLQDQDVVRKISDMTRVCKWSCDSSYYKLWKIMYTKQSVLYHYAIFGCLSYFYKSSLDLKILKKRFRFLSHTHTHTHTHIYCAPVTQSGLGIQGWVRTGPAAENLTVKGRKPDSSTDT